MGVKLGSSRWRNDIQQTCLAVSKRIFEPKRPNITWSWTEVYNEDLCCSLDTMMVTKSMHVTCMGEIRNAHKISVRKTRRKTIIIWSRCRWDDIKWILMKQSMRMNWINLAQDSIQQWDLVNMKINIKFHKRHDFSCLAKKLFASQGGFSYMELYMQCDI